MRKSTTVAAIAALTAGSTAFAGSNGIFLSNLFDDAKGGTLAAAMASDSYGAAASVNDLGVIIRTVGGLGGNSLLAPGITFATASAGGANSAPSSLPGNDRVVANGHNMAVSTAGFYQAIPEPPGGKITDGIGMWGDQLLTFSLDEIRSAGGYAGNQDFTFSSRAGLNDFAGEGGSMKLAFLVSDASGVLFGVVNGVTVGVSQSAGVWSFTGSQPGALTSEGQRLVDFNVYVPSNAKYISLVTLSQGDGIGEDHGVWGNANLTLGRGDIPTPGTLALGAIGALAIARRRRA